MGVEGVLVCVCMCVLRYKRKIYMSDRLNSSGRLTEHSLISEVFHDEPDTSWEHAH